MFTRRLNVIRALSFLLFILMAIAATSCKETTSSNTQPAIPPNSVTGMNELPSNFPGCSPDAVSALNQNIRVATIQISAIEAKHSGQSTIERVPWQQSVDLLSIDQTLPDLATNLPDGYYSSLHLVIDGDSVAIETTDGRSLSVSLSGSSGAPQGLKFIPTNGLLPVISGTKFTSRFCIAGSFSFPPNATPIINPSINILLLGP